jgi:hypothetical protein
MPTIFRYRGFRFFFYSNEGSPRELRELSAVVAQNEALIERAWNEHFG